MSCNTTMKKGKKPPTPQDRYIFGNALKIPLRRCQIKDSTLVLSQRRITFFLNHSLLLSSQCSHKYALLSTKHEPYDKTVSWTKPLHFLYYKSKKKHTTVALMRIHNDQWLLFFTHRTVNTHAHTYRKKTENWCET